MSTSISGTLLMLNTTPSISKTTGGLVITGGVGITGNQHIGSTLTGTSLISSGGIGVSLAAFIGGNLSTGITSSSSLLVNGGFGTLGNITAASDITSQGFLLGAGSSYTGTSGNISLTGNTFDFTSSSGYSFNQPLLVNGGLGVSGTCSFDGNLSVLGNLVCSGNLITSRNSSFIFILIGGGTAVTSFTVNGTANSVAIGTHGRITSTGGGVSVAGATLPYSANFAAGLLSAQNVMVASDSRNKENIIPMDTKLALEMNLKLKPVLFNWKDKMNHVSSTVSGFIAQDVIEVSPSFADKQKPGFVADVYALKDINRLENGSIEILDMAGYTEGDVLRCWLKDCLEEVTVTNALENAVIVATTKKEWFTQDTPNVFVYGKRVEDVHSISPYQILANTVAATQELAKMYSLRLAQFEKIKLTRGV